jgi:hypothetical protein
MTDNKTLASSVSLEILKIKDFKKKTHPLDAKLHPHLPRASFLMCLIAPPRSGKSALIANMLANPAFYNALEYWDWIYYVSPTQSHDNSTRYLTKLENVIQIDDHEELMNLDVILKDLMDGQMKRLQEKDPKTGKPLEMERILIVLDDMLGYLTQNESLSNLCTRYRHYNFSIIITSQSFRKIPLVIRNCTGHIVFFKLNNEKELEKITEEYGELYHSNFTEIARKITETKYNFVYLDNENLKMYRNFTDLILDASK